MTLCLAMVMASLCFVSCGDDDDYPEIHPGTGYEFNSKSIDKPLKTRGLAIFHFRNFPTFSPHLQEFVQSEPRIPHQKSTN